jgi:hypothetical protein
MSVINYFLELKCAGDVLNSVYPFLNPEKEITESMAIIKKIKKLLITNPDKYTIFDFCAGNCLTSSLIAHMFKIKHIFAIDKEKRDRPNFSKIRNFSYNQMDFVEKKKEVIDYINLSTPTIIIGVHPCSELAQTIIEIYNETKTEHLFLMPCCEGKRIFEYPSFLKNKLSTYEMWCLDLCNLAKGNATIDHQCRSNKNIILTASKRKEIKNEIKE